MQRIHRSRPIRVRSHGPVQRQPQPIAPCADGVTATTGIALLAPPFAQALPSLAAIPIEHSHEFRAELVYDLCAALVREGLGTCESWKECGESVLVFAKHAIMRAIGEDRWKLQQLSRIRVRPTYSFIEEGNYDSPPLPSLLVAFKERDAITACFDEEGQYMLEGTSEPAVGVALHPQNSEEVRQALRIVDAPSDPRRRSDPPERECESKFSP